MALATDRFAAETVLLAEVDMDVADVGEDDFPIVEGFAAETILLAEVDMVVADVGEDEFPVDEDDFSVVLDHAQSDTEV